MYGNFVKHCEFAVHCFFDCFISALSGASPAPTDSIPPPFQKGGGPPKAVEGSTQKRSALLAAQPLRPTLQMCHRHICLTLRGGRRRWRDRSLSTTMQKCSRPALLAPPLGELAQRVYGRAVTERVIPWIELRPLSVAARQLSPARGEPSFPPPGRRPCGEAFVNWQIQQIFD